ncbi:MAG: putative DNA binding domain-containing protein [Oscillospiraceae bacterium]|nr:putative DNA binding domain-containing protein [Oscillospiraceae bacterium]
MESKTVEYKREYIDAIKYTIAAFANTDGGKVFIGVEDNGRVCGVTDVDATLLRVTNMIRDAIRPDVTMFAECAVSEMDGKPVVVISVLRGTARPYYLAGKGIRPEGVYVRQGTSSVPASESAILDMIKETSGDSYEDARSLNQQLSFKAASAYFRKKKVEFGDTQKHTLHLIGDDATYTNLALLLSDQCRHTIKMAVFEGSRKTVFKDRRELIGSLLEQLDEAYSYIGQFNRTRAEFAGLDRVERRDYPTEALREALLNAIVHRDYSVASPTLISIFDDRIEFVSIGGLVRGISFDDIMLGVSVLRNEHLANIFYRLHLIEAYGTGMLKINECYAEAPEKPKIEVSDHAFKITLPNMNFKKNTALPQEQGALKKETVSKEDRQKTVLRLLESQDSITRKDVQRLLGVSQATAILLLREMVASGQIVKAGGGKNLHYVRGNSRK